MSRTVPCKTNSGMERQRLPVVQLGPFSPTARSGLTNGSLRPFAPMGLAGVFFSGAGGAVAAACGGTLLPAGLAVLVAAVTGLALIVAATGALLPGFAPAAEAGLAVVVLAEVLAAFCAAPVLLCAGKVPVATGGLEAVVTPFLEGGTGFADEVELPAALAPACAPLAAL